MSLPFGDLLSQHLHRKHSLSQSKLAAGLLQDPSVIGRMCKGQRLTGPQARERVLAITGWLHEQSALETVTEANALLVAAGLSPLRESEPLERALLRQLHRQPTTDHTPSLAPARRTNLPAPLTSFVGRAEAGWFVTSSGSSDGQSPLRGYPKLAPKVQSPSRIGVTRKLSGSLGLAAAGVAGSDPATARTITVIRIRCTFMEDPHEIVVPAGLTGSE
jgi:hypothetical protein